MHLPFLMTYTMVSCQWLVLSLVVLGPGITAQPDTSVCQPTASNHSGPSLPELPKQFSMRVEANLLQKNMTVDVRKWHDGPGDRGAASLWTTSVLLRYLYSYDTDELFTVEQEGDGRYGCQVSPLDTGKQPYLHGITTTTTNNNNDINNATSNNDNNNGSTSAGHVYTAAQSLSFGGAIAEHYMGRARVRGMVADMWDSCVYWATLNATMVVRWYFTVGQEWDTAVGVGRVPVRCRVEGKVHRASTPNPTVFSHLYEVTEFLSYLDGAPQVFETPAGTVCPGRKTTKPVPTMPNRFSYSTEVIDVEARTTQFSKKAYDGQLKLVMVEAVGPSSSTPPLATLRYLDDFNTGARYALDLTRGNCTISPIHPTDADAMSGGSSSLRMRTPQEAFYGTNLSIYSYEGKRSVGEVNTEVWVGKVEPPSTSTPAPSQVWEFYFTSPEWVDREEGVKVGGQVPVSVHFAKNHQEAHQFYNLYNFRDDDPRIWEYDVTSCFQDDPQLSRQLDFFFPVTSAQFLAVLTNQNAFRRALLDSVTSLVTLSPLRVNKIELQISRDEVEVGMVLLETVQMTSPPLMMSQRQEASLVVAVGRVMDAVTRRQLTVRLPTGNGTLVLRASPTSIKTTTTTTSTTTSTTTTTTSTPAPTTTTGSVGPTTNAPTSANYLVCSPESAGYTRGDVAGVAMGMMLAGYVLTLLLTALWTRRCASPGPAGDDRERLEMT